MFNIDRNKVTLFFTLLFIVFLPKIYELGVSPVVCLSILLVFLALYALLDKNNADITIVSIILGVLIFTKLYYPNFDEITLIYIIAAYLTFAFLSFTLLMGPWARFNRNFARILKHRRHIGVTTFLLALTHAYLIITARIYGDLFESISITFIFFGFTGIYIMFLMALTSWNVVQKNNNLKLWSIFHFGGFIMYIMFLLYFIKTTPIENQNVYVYPLLGIFGIYWFLTIPLVALFIKKIFNKPLFVNGWKQLHILVYAAYISVIFHISTGRLASRPDWVKGIFWSIVILVFGSHLFGWYKKLNAKQATSNQNIQE